VIARIETGFADSRAADLSLVFGLPGLPAVGTHRVTLPGYVLELRLLGASHQVLVGEWSETVACLPERAASLPSREEVVVNGLRVRFAAQTLRPGGAGLTDRVSGIIRDCAADEHAIVGEFPGSPLAITAVRAWAEGDGAAWRTWHAYPQAGELVETRTLVRQA
jgi:hypothetical protein